VKNLANLWHVQCNLLDIDATIMDALFMSSAVTMSIYAPLLMLPFHTRNYGCENTDTIVKWLSWSVSFVRVDWLNLHATVVGKKGEGCSIAYRARARTLEAPRLPVIMAL
jgi:hypothetical protein